MRTAVFAAIGDLADTDERVVLLTGDLGFSFVEAYADRHPKRYFNVGVAEQDMVGIATGLAEGGYIPFVYSIATFATLRPYEFIRNGPVAHGFPVRMIGVGGGFEYGPAGRTHHALEDLAVMRVQPGLTVIAPADARQAASAIRASVSLVGPAYFRIGKDDRRSVAELDDDFSVGAIYRIGTGSDAAILATGAIAAEAVEASRMLRAAGVDASCFVMPTISPPPEQDFAEQLRQFPLVTTVEAHYLVGGLGSLVAELIAGAGLGVRLVRIGVAHDVSAITGSEGYLNELNGLSASAICSRVLDELSSGPVGR